VVVVGVALGSGITDALVWRMSPTRQRCLKRDDVIRSRRGMLPLSVGCVDKRRAQSHDQLQREQQQARKQSDLAVAREWGKRRHPLLIDRS
jgi:hypothetical protein